MIVCHVGRLFKLAVIAMSLFIAGCASSLTRIDTWEGDLPEATEAAVLKSPGNIQVTRVNGKSMQNYLMDDLALDYGLLPGNNEVVFTYKTIWAKSGVVSNGESKVHVVETEPQMVRFGAEPGAVYTFELKEPSNRKEAEALRDNFSASIVGVNGDVVARADAWSGRPTARTPLSGADAGYSEAAPINTLEKLQTLWGQATEEEKKTFLRWPRRWATRATCVSTEIPGTPKALPRTTLAVLRPTPGSVTRSSRRPGTSPPKRSQSAWAMPRMLAVFARKNPVGRMSSSSFWRWDSSSAESSSKTR